MISPTLVGRTAELDALRAASAAAGAGESRIVLVGGDAGIGKTRLVAEFCEHARTDGLLTAVGGCVQLGEVAIAYAPLIEALRHVSRQLGAEVFTELVGHGEKEMGALLGTRGAADASDPGPLFEHMLSFLTRLGQRQPTVLVLEDMHWADASTLALSAYLGRNLRTAGVALVLTYRSDELHRRHPLRPLLTDLERDPDVERVRLGGLSRTELTELITSIAEEPPQGSTIDDLLARTEGNPFFVEELVAAAPTHGTLPDTLAEVVLARVGRLSAATQEVLHRAAVLGDEVDERLLAAISGRDLDAVTVALREALFEQLLVLDGASCRFRHALIREALYDDLLPGERERLHVAAAEAVRDPELADRLDEHARWAMLAHHWDAAREPVPAFIASIRAGAEAEKVRALADAAAHFERALRLWGHVPDPADAAGMSKADLLLRTADAVHYSSHSPRAVTLCKAALDALGPDAEPERRALVLHKLSRTHWTQYEGAAAVAAVEEAAALLADRPASREQAFTLAWLGQSLMLRGLNRPARDVLNRAIAMAAELGAADVEAHALCSLGPALVDLGRGDDGLAALYRATDLARRHGTTAEVCRCHTNLGHSLMRVSRYAEAEAAAVEAIAHADAAGLLRHYGEAITGNRVAALYCSGRWQDAEAAISGLAKRVPIDDPYVVLRWLPLLIGQGRLDRAGELVDWVVAITAEADDVQFRALALLRAATLAAARRHWSDARRLAADGLVHVTTDEQYYALLGFSLALGIEADRIEAVRVAPHAEAEIEEARTVADALIERTRKFAEQLAGGDVALLPEPAALLRAAEADHARAHGRDDGDQWAELATEWERVGQPYPAAIARLHEADAVLRGRGDRARAAEAAAAALSVAEKLGAEPLATEVRLLVQRGRLDLPVGDAAAGGGQPDPLAALGVTPREADVLAQLAAGRTNRQIGESLFISEKTASVHVTNLLRKLGVSSRLEAAVVAQRLGLPATPVDEAR